MHDGSHDRTFAIRPITLTYAPSSDHLITRAMLSLHCTTLAFVAQRTHPDIRHIARRSITYHCTTLAYCHFRTCMLSYEHFFHANIHKTDWEFLRSHDILVASDHATIVKGPYLCCAGTQIIWFLYMHIVAASMEIKYTYRERISVSGVLFCI